MVGFPLLLIPLAIYNIIVFLMPSVSFTDPLVKLALMSGAEWTVTLSDVLLTVGILLLLAEVIKGARPGAKYLTDHLLSLIVFGVAAAEFVLWQKFGTSTYFLLTALALVDFISGLALRTRRRTVAVAAAPVPPPKAAEPPPKAVEKVEAPAEPKIDPAPAAAPAPAAPSVPPAASVAESVLKDHSDRNRCSPPSRPRQLRRKRRHRKFIRRKPRHRKPRRRKYLHRGSVAGIAAGPRLSVTAGQASALIHRVFEQGSRWRALDGLPRPEAGAATPALAGAIGGLRICQRSPPQAAGLRRLVGGRDQLRDEGWIGPRRRFR